jgi:hypothetical protein
MISWERIAAAWAEFFHTQTTSSTIGLFRIVWGLLLTANAAVLIRDVNRYFGPGGLLSASEYRSSYGRSRLCLFRWLPESDHTAPMLLALHLLAAVGLTLGCCTRLSCTLVFVTLVSFHHRNPAVFHSGDSLMRLLTFLLIFSRSGSSLSFDVWLATGDVLPAASGSVWCERLMQLQVSIVYLRTVHWKLRGKYWPDGTAAYYPTQIEAFQRVRLPRFLRHLFWTRLATWGTLAVQIAIGVGVWIEELRWWVLVAGIALHLTFEIFLNLQFFGAIMISSYLLFLDPLVVDRLLRPSDVAGGLLERESVHGSVEPRVAQSQGIADDAQGAEDHGGGGEQGMQRDSGNGHECSGGERNADDVIREREQQILADVAHHGAAEPHRSYNPGQIAADQADAGRLDRDVASRAHGDSHGGSGQGRRVVDAVTHHDNDRRLRIGVLTGGWRLAQFVDPADLVFGMERGLNFLDAQLAADRSGGRGMVAGQHHGRNPHVVQCRDDQRTV